MYIFFLPLIFLPLIEIFVFVKMIHALGFLRTLVWIVGATMLGFYLLQARGPAAWGRWRQDSRDMFGTAGLFDDVCLRIAGMLLVFPGFISDFIAIPFLIAPLRRWLFGKFGRAPDPAMRPSPSTEAFYSRTAEQHTIIDGEFRKIDNNDQ